MSSSTGSVHRRGLLLLASASLTESVFPRIDGCGGFGCDSSNSYTTAKAIPRNSSLLFEITLDRTNASSSIVSPGCISQNVYASCSYPLYTGVYYWSGFVLFDSSGEVRTKYTDVGSASCYDNTQFGASGSRAQGLPAMDVGGDVIGVDVNGVTLLQGDSAAWTQSPLFPAAACPDFIPSVSVSQTGRLLMFIASLGEIFGYYSDSVPVGSLNLFANDTASVGPIAPGFLPHTGVLVPISQQAVINQRTLIVTRFYHTDAYQVRPNLASTPQIRLSATDLQDNKMPRIARPWTIDLPMPAEYSTPACQPIPYPNPIYAGQERIVITGPTAIANGRIVVAFVCPGVSTSMYVMGIHGDDGSGGANASFVPTVQWTLSIPLPTAQPPTITQGSVAYMAVDASAAPEDSSLVWLSVGGGLYLIDGQAGRVVCSDNLLSVFSSLQTDAQLPTSVAVEAPMLLSNGSFLGSSSVVLALTATYPSPAGHSTAGASGGNSTVHYIAHLEIRATSCTSTVVWMSPVPGAHPGQYGVQGQMAIVNKDTAGRLKDGSREGEGQVQNVNIITFVTQEGIFGVGG